jgi:cytochrome c peroxidase
VHRLISYLLALAACASAAGEPDLGPPPPGTPVLPDGVLNPRLLRRFPALTVPPPATGAAAEQIALGKQLFFDRRLSRNADTSCSSCHPLDRGGVDHRAISIGTAGRIGVRNAPTVFNAARYVAQFWDGRAATLEEQARGPLTAEHEMAFAPAELVARLRAIPGYSAAFARAFPEQPLGFEQVTGALAAFERTLVTPARWDRYLRGDRTALSAAEVRGARVFADVGCVQCHTGELVGGAMFQKVGGQLAWPNQRDQGRYEVTHLAADRMVFKVPSLRNVAVTAPYFHDGSVSDLGEAVRMMARHQLGFELEPDEVTAIVTWLGALTGEVPDVTPPALP